MRPIVYNILHRIRSSSNILSVANALRSNNALGGSLVLARRTTRFYSTLRGGAYTNFENRYVFSIINGSSLVDSESLPTEHIGDILDEKSFTAYLNKAWRKSSAPDIVKAFKELKSFCVKNDITFDDPRFDSLIDGVMDHCDKLSDEELLELLKCICEYPSCTYMAHNFHDLWSCLDDICCWKMNTWDINKLFAFCDLWYKLGLGKMGDFIFEVLNKLPKKADMMTKDQLVRIFFYFNVCRKRPVDFEYEYALERKAIEINVDELAVVALGYFKSKSMIKVQPVLGAMIKEVTRNALNIHEISLTAIMKVLRLSCPTKHIPEIKQMFDAIYPQLDRFSDLACLHVALLATGLQTFHPDILRKCSQKLAENISNTRIKDIERLLNVLTMFTYDPQSKPDIFKLAFEELHKDSRIAEINRFPRCLPSALHYLSLRGIYSYKLMDRVLDFEFVTLNFGKHAKLLPQQVFSLDACVDIECPDYTGNRLPPSLKYKAAKWLTLWPPSHNQYTKISPKDRLFLDTLDALKNIVKNPEFVKVCHVLPHFPSAVMVVCKDQTGQFVKPIGFDGYVLGDVMKPFNDGTLKWYVIKVLTWNNTMRETNMLFGYVSMELRQLEKIGYNPVMVVWYEFKDLSPEDKERYIMAKIALQS